MRKVHDFQKIRQFAHKPKVRRNAARIINLQADQGLELTAWKHTMAVKNTRVDVERANWQGYIVYSAYVFDPRPRLRRTNNG